MTSQLEANTNHEIVIALDIALTMLQTMQEKWVGQNVIKYVCADAEHLPFIENSIDSVFLIWLCNGAVILGAFLET